MHKDAILLLIHTILTYNEYVLYIAKQLLNFAIKLRKATCPILSMFLSDMFDVQFWGKNDKSPQTQTHTHRGGCILETQTTVLMGIYDNGSKSFLKF